MEVPESRARQPLGFPKPEIFTNLVALLFVTLQAALLGAQRTHRIRIRIREMADRAAQHKDVAVADLLKKDDRGEIMSPG